MEACWGDVAEREQVRRTTQRGQRRVLATSMGSFSLGGTVAYGLVGLGPGVLVWGMLGSLTGGMLARYKGIRERKVPQGANVLPIVADVSLRGTVRGAHGLVSPASAEACLAYSLELRHRPASIALRRTLPTALQSRSGGSSVLGRRGGDWRRV